MNIFINIISILAVIFFVGSVQFKEKRHILLSQYFASVFYAISYFLSGGYSGAITELIEQIKNIIFYFYEKNNKNIPLSLLMFFLSLIILVAIITYKGINTLVPLINNILYFISSYFKNPIYIRVVMILCAILWIYYNLSIGLKLIIIGNIFEIISASISIIRFKEKRVRLYDNN